MAETSTGASQPIEEIARVVHDAGRCCWSMPSPRLGGMPVEVDAWGIDAIYSGTQKCLQLPAGLAPVSFNARAMDVVLKRKTKVQSWYLDVSMLARYWSEERVYHHTAPINMTYGLYEALRLVLEEGLDRAFARHLLNHRALKQGLAALGIRYAAAEGHQLPMLNAVLVPAGVDDAAVRRGLLERFGIEIGGGLGAFKGKAWRIGLMGHGSRSATCCCCWPRWSSCWASKAIAFRPAPEWPPPTRFSPSPDEHATRTSLTDDERAMGRDRRRRGAAGCWPRRVRPSAAGGRCSWKKIASRASDLMSGGTALQYHAGDRYSRHHRSLRAARPISTLGPGGPFATSTGRTVRAARRADQSRAHRQDFSR